MSSASQTEALAPFARLIDGEWHTDGSYQVFEWAVGQTAVKARSFALQQGAAQLVSEGVWFWHPGQRQIKGFFTAVDMPVAFFDYTTRFEGKRMISDLTAYSAGGEAQAYVETWEFTDADHYAWTLAGAADGKDVMRAAYARKT